MNDKEVPLGKLYISKRLYGEDMVALKKALNEAGFDLNIDPIQDHAELVKLDGEE